MEPINEIILVTVTAYSGTDSSDKNGENPLMLQCVAGRMPNRNVLAGTVALRSGFEIGKTYLVNVRENGTDKIYGQDFTFIKIKELTEGLDIVRSIKELGSPQIITIQRPAEFEESNYQRKTNAIEGQRAVRIKEGLYTPAYSSTSIDHHTAQVIKEGSSISATETLFGKSLVDELEKKPETKA